MRQYLILGICCGMGRNGQGGRDGRLGIMGKVGKVSAGHFKHFRQNGHGGLIIYKVVGAERGEKAYKRRKKINS